MENTCFSISAVERELGLSKDVLRAWERRYGFPVPSRDERDERLYPADQIAQLRLVKRLMDQGLRPGRLLKLSPEELRALADTPRPSTGSIDVGGQRAGAVQAIDELVGRIRGHQGEALIHALQRRLVDQGLRAFVQDTMAPLTQAVGLAWERGGLCIHEEHLFTEAVSRVVRQAITALPAASGPRLLLTTLPGEAHGLGLLMAEAIFALEGARCIPLGTQTPVLEIAEAARSRAVDGVALSFSAAFPARQVPALLRQLRGALPADIRLWAGGAGLRRGAATDGVHLLATLDEAAAAVAGWHPGASGPVAAAPGRSA